jgi:hypothetical protein
MKIRFHYIKTLKKKEIKKKFENKLFTFNSFTFYLFHGNDYKQKIKKNACCWIMTLGSAMIALLLKISIEPEPKRRSVDTLWRLDASRLEGVSLKWYVPCLVVLYFQPTRSTCRFFSISPFDVSVSRKATRRSWHNRKVTKKSTFIKMSGWGVWSHSPTQKSEKKASSRLPVSSVCAVL